jgi:acyl-homoserine-lactone acylase
MRKAIRRLGLALVLLLMLAAVNALANAPFLARFETLAEPRPRDVVIRRDRWGVPHVKGRTDADAAFGLAYAHAEDDFVTLEQVMAGTRGRGPRLCDAIVAAGARGG